MINSGIILQSNYPTSSEGFNDCYIKASPRKRMSLGRAKNIPNIIQIGGPRIIEETPTKQPNDLIPSFQVSRDKIYRKESAFRGFAPSIETSLSREDSFIEQSKIYNELKSEIENILQDCKKSGWDGEDAEPITDVHNALKFLKGLRKYDLLNKDLTVEPISKDLIFFKFKDQQTGSYIGIFVHTHNRKFTYTYRLYKTNNSDTVKSYGTLNSFIYTLKLITNHQDSLEY